MLALASPGVEPKEPGNELGVGPLDDGDALAQQAAGNVGTARSLRDEILGDRMLNLDNGSQITARRLVKRIN